MPNLTKVIGNIARAANLAYHPREDIVASGALAAAASGTWVQVDGAHLASIVVAGTYSLTWRLLGVRGGTGAAQVVEQIPYRRRSDLSVFVATRTTANEAAIFDADVAGYEAVRLDVIAFTSGSMAWEIATSVSAQPSGGLIKLEPAQFSINAFGVAS